MPKTTEWFENFFSLVLPQLTNVNYYENVEKVKNILRECCTHMAACEKKYLITFNGEALESSLLGGNQSATAWDALFPDDSPLIAKFIPMNPLPLNGCKTKQKKSKLRQFETSCDKCCQS